MPDPHLFYASIGRSSSAASSRPPYFFTAEEKVPARLAIDRRGRLILRGKRVDGDPPRQYEEEAGFDFHQECAYRGLFDHRIELYRYRAPTSWARRAPAREILLRRVVPRDKRRRPWWDVPEIAPDTPPGGPEKRLKPPPETPL